MIADRPRTADRSLAVDRARTNDRTRATDRPRSDAELTDRLRTLRSLLPAMAAEAARARRESIRLRNENATLQERLATMENNDRIKRARVVMPLTPGDEVFR